ncbi:amino acid-binding protein [Mobilitalea sibirica]|uniref:Amino acid-binding protein n=1 Tax=Mobilitalea sibirica TaxID=1462919 RepID=A0A8J7KVT9_9FIRM|nr:ACT domain-containing protein [Mobilitalea sibirica]MBH1939552.1 amino acid-binding protein [Mobilitalea sibirica]
MVIKQLSVFIENREGRLERVTEALRERNINIASFSLADTSEYGLLRMIVSDPEEGQKVLKEEGFSAKLTDVIAVKIAQRPGTLHEVLKILFDAGLSVEYMYTLATAGKDTSIIMKLSNLDRALEVLQAGKYAVCTDKEAYEINNHVDK